LFAQHGRTLTDESPECDHVAVGVSLALLMSALLIHYQQEGESRAFSIMSFANQAEDADRFSMRGETSDPSPLPNVYRGERALAGWGGEIGDTCWKARVFYKSEYRKYPLYRLCRFLNEADIKWLDMIVQE